MEAGELAGGKGRCALTLRLVRAGLLGTPGLARGHEAPHVKLGLGLRCRHAHTLRTKVRCPVPRGRAACAQEERKKTRRAPRPEAERRSERPRGGRHRCRGGRRTFVLDVAGLLRGRHAARYVSQRQDAGHYLQSTIAIATTLGRRSRPRAATPRGLSSLPRPPPTAQAQAQRRWQGRAPGRRSWIHTGRVPGRWSARTRPQRPPSAPAAACGGLATQVGFQATAGKMIRDTRHT